MLDSKLTSNSNKKHNTVVCHWHR